MQEPANLDLAKVTTKLELLTGNGKREATHAIVCIALIHSHAFVVAVAKSMLMIRNLVQRTPGSLRRSRRLLQSPLPAPPNLYTRRRSPPHPQPVAAAAAVVVVPSPAAAAAAAGASARAKLNVLRYRFRAWRVLQRPRSGGEHFTDSSSQSRERPAVIDGLVTSAMHDSSVHVCATTGAIAGLYQRTVHPRTPFWKNTLIL